jgi:putative hydrolase of the HAD superfamily
MTRVATLPRAVLLDLDDTIVDDSGAIQEAWLDACSACSNPRLPAEIASIRDWFWSDADRHRIGRLDLPVARRQIVRMAMDRLDIRDEHLVDDIASRYETLRDKGLTLIPGAVETIQWLRSGGCKTALVTNGASAAQRAKIMRFNLESLFDAVLIEGELEYGKPDHRVFQAALAGLDSAPDDTWMIGDNLMWDVAPAKALGMQGIWIDTYGLGLPQPTPCRPDRVVRALTELRQQPRMQVTP